MQIRNEEGRHTPARRAPCKAGLADTEAVAAVVPWLLVWLFTGNLAHVLREFACELTSSWPPARVEGRVWGARGALLGQDPPNPVNPVNPASVPECVFWSNTPTLLADFYEERYSGTV